MRVYYKCYYDGRECNKVIPRFDDKGNLIPEPDDEYKDKSANKCWNVCIKCSRNLCIDGCCYGNLKIGD